MPSGRPSKFTEETKNNIIAHLENGATYKRAAILSGASQSLFQRWKQSGVHEEEEYEAEMENFREEEDRLFNLIDKADQEKDIEASKKYNKELGALKMPKKGIYFIFLERVRQAKEHYIAWLQQQVNDNAKTDGKLALEVLARKRPEEFGRRDKLDIRGNFDVNKFDVELTPEEEALYKKRLQDMYGEGDSDDG